MDCREASRTQSEALDGALSTSQRTGLWLHTRICKWCRRYGKQLRFLHQTAKTHPEELAQSAPLALSDAARERIKQRLSNDDNAPNA